MKTCRYIRRIIRSINWRIVIWRTTWRIPLVSRVYGITKHYGPRCLESGCYGLKYCGAKRRCCVCSCCGPRCCDSMCCGSGWYGCKCCWSLYADCGVLKCCGAICVIYTCWSEHECCSADCWGDVCTCGTSFAVNNELDPNTVLIKNNVLIVFEWGWHPDWKIAVYHSASTRHFSVFPKLLFTTNIGHIFTNGF